jgi:hypothetical protein
VCYRHAGSPPLCIMTKSAAFVITKLQFLLHHLRKRQ